MSDRIKILYLAANPRDTSHLRLQEEAREMEDRIRQGPHRDAFQVVHYLAVRSRDLLRGLQEVQPHILHFSGHGTYNNEIVLEANDGSSQPVAPNDLAQLVSLFNTNLKVAVLSSCFARKQAKALHRVLDFTIGAANPISDAGVVNFSATFYQVLAAGGTINQAFSAARVLNNIEGRKVFETSDLLVKKGADADQPFINLVSLDDNDTSEPKLKPDQVKDRGGQTIYGGEVGIAQVLTGDNSTTTNNYHSK